MIRDIYIKVIEYIREKKRIGYRISRVIKNLQKIFNDELEDYPISVYGIKYEAWEYGLDKLIRTLIKTTGIELIHKNNYFHFDNYITLASSFVFLRRYNFGFDCYPMLKALEIIKPDWDVAFDVGANEGIVSLFLAKYAKKVHAFEPCPRTAEIANKNMSLNSFNNIVLNKVAVSDKAGGGIFYDFGEETSGHNSLIQSKVEQAVDVYDVPVTTIELYCKKHTISKIDFLKIDVEGLEYEVLIGAGKTFIELHLIEIICFEISCMIVNDWAKEDKLIEYLKKNGYVLFDLKFNEFDYQLLKRCKGHQDVLAIAEEKCDYYRNKYKDMIR